MTSSPLLATVQLGGPLESINSTYVALDSSTRRRTVPVEASASMSRTRLGPR